MQTTKIASKGFVKKQTARAKDLRRNQTEAEKKLWVALLELKQSHGLKFRRQQPIDKHIVDFFCPALKCVIEIDGASHDGRQSQDALREGQIKEKGYKIFRYTESEVRASPQNIISSFLAANGKTPPPAPPSRGGENEGNGELSQTSNRILVGQIIGAHGIKGEVKVKAFTDSPSAIAAYGPLEDEAGIKKYTLKVHSEKQGVVIAGVKGVASRNDAEALVKLRVKLFAPRTALPKAEKGRFYFADLVGLEAKDEDGKFVGRVKGAHNFGGGDMVEIEPEKGSSFMLPLKEPFAHSIDLKKGTLQVFVPEDWQNKEKGLGARDQGLGKKEKKKEKGAKK